MCRDKDQNKVLRHIDINGASVKELEAAAVYYMLAVLVR
mgnify:FL=1